MLSSVISGLAIGGLGSFHCIGMCGPIALSLPFAGQGKIQAVWSLSLYHFGRALTYGILGILFGFLGTQFRIWGLQQIVSILAGILLLAFIWFHFKLRMPGTWYDSFQHKIRAGLQKRLGSTFRTSTFFFIGLLNGLLPCGLVYVAIVAALTTGKLFLGGLLMFSFGVGTMPLMTGLIFFGRLISVTHRHQINKAVPYLVSVMACLLILRGLNLGIPYVSPKMGVVSKEVPTCHGVGVEEGFFFPQQE